MKRIFRLPKVSLQSLTYLTKRQKLLVAGISSLVVLILTSLLVYAATSSRTINNSSTTQATGNPTQHALLSTSDGTLHSFVQVGSQPADCSGTPTTGLIWFYSVDSGNSWTCGGQLTATTTYYGSGAVDALDNVYVTYSDISGGASATSHVYYRKLTKGGGSTWTLEAEQQVASGSPTTGYSYSVIEVQADSRLWLATRYYDGSNFNVAVYYSSDQSTSPSWTLSQQALNTPGSSAYYMPVIVRFGDKIGVIYQAQFPLLTMKWRMRADTDPLDQWSNEEIVTTTIGTTGRYAAVGDTNGNIYFTVLSGGTVVFNYFNGQVWSPNAIVATTALGIGVSVTTDGSSAWVFYQDTTGLIASGSYATSRLVYKQGRLPYTTFDFDDVATPVVDHHQPFDSVWHYLGSGTFTNLTTAASNTTVADVTLPASSGDMIYFGKAQEFDAVSWVSSQNGTAGVVAWEYWNGIDWTSLTPSLNICPNFTCSGYITFTEPGDWATTVVNGEGTPRYYVRARTTTSYSQLPIGSQMMPLTNIYWANFLPNPLSGQIHGIWSENANNPVRVKSNKVTVTTTTPNSASRATIAPYTVGYSSTTNASYPSNLNQFVRTSDGTQHAFINGQHISVCGSGTGESAMGLNWAYSTDDGATWLCGGQLYLDQSSSAILMYGSAVVDGDDNIYVTYATNVGGGSGLYNLNYRKLTKGAGSTWTLEAQQTIATAASTTGYSFASIGVDGVNRLWVAAKYFDGTNYMVRVFYSSDTSAAPVWTISAASLDLANNDVNVHAPAVIRFGDKIGVVYTSQGTAVYNNLGYNGIRWRFRADTDAPTAWSNDSLVMNSNVSYGNFSVATYQDRIYLAINTGSYVYLTQWNGNVWLPLITVANNVAWDSFISVVTDGAQVFVFYADRTGYVASTYGDRNIVYARCYIGGGGCSNPVPVVSQNRAFDRYWSHVGGVFTNHTSQAANLTAGDTQMISGSGSAAYFGMLTQFDTISYVLSTAGASGKIAWEYWNGSAWMELTDFYGVFAPTLTASGFVSFDPPSDWATTSINGEGGAYYYVRARARVTYSAAPVATQILSLSRPHWGSFLPYLVGGEARGIWTENVTSPIRVRYGSFAMPALPAVAGASTDLSPYTVAYSATANATFPTTTNRLVRTSDGTLHAFVQSGYQLACGSQTGANNDSLMWIFSTDEGVNWTCGGQLNNDLNANNVMHASATTDSNDNIYVVYSNVSNGSSPGRSAYYRKLTKQAGPNWVMEAPQTVLSAASGLVAYTFATIEIDSQDRLWLVVRYYDGTNYNLSVYYGSDTSAAPTWNLSQLSLNTPTSAADRYYPVLVKFGGQIGVIYSVSYQTAAQTRWRFRADTDPLTQWSGEETVGTGGDNINVPFYTAVGDAQGRVYYASSNYYTTYFSYWNGVAWSETTTVHTTGYVTPVTGIVAKDDTVWVTFGDSNGFTGIPQNQPGYFRMAYKKGIAPFSASEFDLNPTPLTLYQGSFDKYWSQVAGVFTNDTADAASITASDTQLFTNINDAAYFGKTVPFDQVTWETPTAGVGGQVVWEYWNGSTWAGLGSVDSIAGLGNFTGARGYLSYDAPADWAPTSVNGELESYYYLRARVVVNYSSPPVATQINANDRSYVSAYLPTPINDKLYGLYSTNINVAPVKVRFNATSVDPVTTNPATYSELKPTITSSVLYAGSTNRIPNATRYSTQREFVETSQGYLHGFIQVTTAVACGGSTAETNTIGLVWVYSTDSGQTWNCAGQLSDILSYMMYASATIDEDDNIYVTYAPDIAGSNAFNSLYYRKLTKTGETSWTLGPERLVAAGSPTSAYNIPTIEQDSSDRLWIAARYFDNNNYQVSVFYSDDDSDNPTWTLSQQALNTPANSSGYHIPAIVKFDGKIGVIYNSQVPANIRWRYRADTDPLTDWVSEAQVSTVNIGAATFSASADATGNVYVAMNSGANVWFTYFNGSVWSANANVSNTACSSCFTSVSMVGTTAYVYYGDTTLMHASLPGNRRIVYKKGVAPYSAADFDVSATPLIPWHGQLSKVWLFTAAGSSFTDLTTPASNNTLADTTMPTLSGDMLYLGSTQRYDSLSWLNSTAGVGGIIAWEYWNGSSWRGMTGHLSRLNPSFINSGYLLFMPPSDWATTSINGEGESYYYLRGRVVATFSQAPVLSQLVAIPPISWATSLTNTSDVISIWVEGGAAPNRVRFFASYFNVPPRLPSSLGPAGLVTGQPTVDNTPTLNFNSTDPNVGDIVQHQLQIATDEAFTSLVVDYLSPPEVPGAKSFTVGQPAGGGTYTQGSEGQTLADGAYYWRVKTFDQALLESAFTTANGGAVAFSVDTTRPSSNADNIIMLRTSGNLPVASNSWTNLDTPYFSWDAAADNPGGSGISGYCLYLGTDPAADPETSKGLLGTSPGSTAGTTCQFISNTTSLVLTNLTYHGDPWLTTSMDPYYLNIKAVDQVGNTFNGSIAQFQFRFDDQLPTNVTYISPAGGNFSNVSDMSFFWPTSGDNISSDAHSGVLGWQYQINSTSGTWKGPTYSNELGLDYIPLGMSMHQLSSSIDGSSIVGGNNNIYFRTIDVAGNPSSNTTIRTGVILYGGAAPQFGGSDVVTITPDTSVNNNYQLSWPSAVAGQDQTVTKYYYMINTFPPSTLDTLLNNPATYLDNGLSTSVALGSLPNVNRGTNTVYVVAIDDATPPNYSALNNISGTFVLNSTNPDNVNNLIISDSSIKSQQMWNVTLTWTAPSYQGAGNLTYVVHRSDDGTTFAPVGTSSGLSYVDNVPESKTYHYKVFTRDGAAALSSGTNSVSIIPTGRWTEPPALDSGPVVSKVTTNKATISWTTSRSADSKVQYGLESGVYEPVEPSSSIQVTGHEINLTGLQPGSTYYFKAKWTDEDGNTATSDEKVFVTDPPPTVSNVRVSNIGLSSAILSFTTKGASGVRVYYGTTTNFGSVKTVSTAPSESNYSVELDQLSDGTKYFFKINTLDSDSSEYDNQVNDFSTLPRPKISGVRVQQVVNTAQTTLLVTWNTNTAVSSIVSYYPEGNPAAVRDEVNVTLTTGAHRMIVGGLLPQTTYILTVRGRDRIGNEAISDSLRVDTSIDTRPPAITDFRVETSNIPINLGGDQPMAQLVVTWTTDEPATSQVEYGEGSNSTYAQKTQKDESLTYNHMVIISNLTPAKVYHLRAVSEDKAGNVGTSVDTVTITPKATDDALYLVITNLQQIFGFLRNINQ